MQYSKALFHKCKGHCSWTNLLMRKLYVCVWVWLVWSYEWIQWCRPTAFVMLASCFSHRCVCVCVHVHVYRLNIRSSGDFKITWVLLAQFQRLTTKFIVMYTWSKAFMSYHAMIAWSLPNTTHAINVHKLSTPVMATVYTSASQWV